MKRFSMLLGFALIAVGCGNGSSGNAFCDGYGEKIAALKCSKGVDQQTLADDCRMIIDADSKCSSQYMAVLSCQQTTSTCAGDGTISFGDCQPQTDAYSACKSK